jgi:CubicO group peptidase (beta-lactamase class C family)
MKYTFFALVLLMACKPVKETKHENALASKLDAYFTEYVKRVHVPGLTIAITRNDSVIYTRAFGFRNIEAHDPMKVTNFFHWASVSKTFVATAIMQLVEQKKLNLDEKLITYLPYFKLKDDNYKKITIRQMLNHTSGIGDVDDYEWDKPQYDEGAPEKYVRSLANDKMRFAPGTDWRYSNTAYEILGVLITKASGMPFETYLKKNIMEPLEMTTTSFIYPEIPDSLRVSGHVWAAGPVVSKVYPYNRIHAPSSTLNSSVLEMTHYAMAHLHRGVYNGKRILQDSTYKLVWTNSVNMKDKPKIGLSWWLDELNGTRVAMHSGGDTGFRSFLLLAPEENFSIELVSNYELTSTGDLAHAVFDIMKGSKPDVIKQRIGLPFVQVMKSKGIDSAKEFYKKTNADSVQRKNYVWDENRAALAYAGYMLMEQKMFSDAIEVFKFNIEEFPKSSHAYGHLARCYVKSGDKKLAVATFKKAIELLPNDEQAKKDFRGEFEQEYAELVK